MADDGGAGAVRTEIAVRFTSARPPSCTDVVRQALAAAAEHLAAISIEARIEHRGITGRVSVGAAEADTGDLPTGLPREHQRIVVASRGADTTVDVEATLERPSADAESLLRFVCDLTRHTTERLAAETDAAAELARYQAIVHNASDIVLVLGDDGTIMYASSSAGDVMGFDVEPMIGTNIFELVHPDDVEMSLSALAGTLASGAGVKAPLEVRVRNASGEYRWMTAIANNQFDNPLVRGVVVNARDDTERHEAAAAVQVSEARLRAVLDGSTDVICVVDASGSVITWNRAASRLLPGASGRMRDDLFAIMHPDDRPIAERAIGEIFSGNRGPDERSVVRVADGQGGWRFLETSGQNLLDDPFVKGVVLTSRDITEQMHAMNSALASSAQLSALVGSLHDAIVLMNPSGDRVLYSNAGFADMIGLSLPALYEADRSELLAAFRRTLVDADGWRTQTTAEFTSRRPHRRFEVRTLDRRFYERDYLPVENDGTLYGHLWVFHDVTQRKQTEESLADALDAAVHASEVKSSFVAAVGHEIRTPMHAILGLLELLADTPLGDEQRALLSTVQNSAVVLRAMLDDLLDFSKIEAGHLEISNERFDVLTTVEQAVAMLRPAAAARGLFLTYHAERDVPAAAIGDAVRLRQIVVNLVDNAVKYTEQGSVTVSIERCPGGTERSVPLRIVVRDTGVGIPPEAIDSLFQPFVQVAEGRRPDTRGTGLGLAISQRLAELMGGSITVESTPGAGSTFVLTVSLGVAGPLVIAATSSPRARATRRARVLVVEDDSVNQTLARRQLQRLGHEAIVVGSGEDAVAMAARGELDVVLMDRRLPGIDGLEATRRIRTREDRENGRRLPIIAMTASAFADDERACIAAGTDGYLAKPVSLRALQSAIDRVIDSAGDRARFVEPPKRPSQADTTIDTAALATLVDEMESVAVVVNVVASFVDTLPSRRDAILDAATRRDAAALADAAHALAGAALVIGAPALAGWCRAVEITAADTDVVPDPFDAAALAALCEDTTVALSNWLAETRASAASDLEPDDS